jgi:serine/threonine protein kinase
VFGFSLSLLGSGSFADVYRAEWRMPCAVKKMKGRISKEMMTEFVREGEMMRSLKHPGIVKLLGVCVEGGSFYLVQVRFAVMFVSLKTVADFVLISTNTIHWSCPNGYLMDRKSSTDLGTSLTTCIRKKPGSHTGRLV